MMEPLKKQRMSLMKVSPFSPKSKDELLYVSFFHAIAPLTLRHLTSSIINHAQDALANECKDFFARVAQPSRLCACQLRLHAGSGRQSPVGAGAERSDGAIRLRRSLPADQ